MGIELCGRTAVEGAETDTEKETVEDEPDDEEGEREHGKSDVSVSLSLSRRQRAMPNKDAQVTAADSQKTPAMPRWIARRSSVGRQYASIYLLLLLRPENTSDTSATLYAIPLPVTPINTQPKNIRRMDGSGC